MSEIVTLAFRPSRHGDLGIEASTFAELRARAGALLSKVQRLEFHCLLHFTRGSSEPRVDFEPHACRAGSTLHITPMQAFRLDLPPGVEGYVVIHRSELLPPDRDEGWLGAFQRAAVYTARETRARARVEVAFRRVRERYGEHDASEHSARLLRYELLILWSELARIAGDRTAPTGDALVRRFRAVLEERYRTTRRVEDYARALRCSPKTLQRALLRATGRSAKAEIDARVALEAKRLLIHTELTVVAIAHSLGFSEATNFTKFFTREVGTSPSSFATRERRYLEQSEVGRRPGGGRHEPAPTGSRFTSR